MLRIRGAWLVTLILISACKEEAVELQELHKSSQSAFGLQMGSGRVRGNSADLSGDDWHLKALKFWNLEASNLERPPCSDINTDASSPTIGVSDSGLDSKHPDLVATESRINFLGGTNIDPDPDVAKEEGDHGTSVAGIIGAKCQGTTQSIFPGLPLGGMNLLAPSVLSHPNLNSFFIEEPTKTFQIVNQSWGALPSYWVQSGIDQQYASHVAMAAKTNNRIFVKASGNQWPQDAAYDPQNQSPYVIVVAASNRTNAPASFSQAGANLWVTAPGEDIDTLEATAKIPASDQEVANYNLNFSGTSAAAPMVTGVVALMLQKNSGLSWRDIKYILAETSTKVGEQGWVTNQAGFHFSRDYGFGLVDAKAAVERAECKVSNSNSAICANKTFSVDTFQEEPLGSQSVSLGIPDNQETGITSSLTTSTNLTIEAIELTLNITHQFPSDLHITLTSPSGTEAVVLAPHPGFFTRAPHMRNIRLMVNHFYGENTKHTSGKWTLKIADRWQEDSGTLNSWSLKAYGH